MSAGDDDRTTPLSELETYRQSSREPSARTAFSAGQVVANRYRIVRFIARGGMGEVFEAEDLELHGNVALKTIRPEIGEQERVIERFKREIQMARKVTHPNVSRIFDIGRHRDGERDVIFVTMELLDGRTLTQRIRQSTFTPEEALPIVRQMADGLQAAHRVGVVHRDFKSANVMLIGERAVVTDFGLARTFSAHDAAMTGTGDIVGTPAYMAPEQLEGKAVTPATDIYALGMVLYEMVTGKLPFAGETPIAAVMKRLKEPPPSPRTFVPQLDAKWEKTILRCLQRDPADRFSNATDVVRSLEGESVELRRTRKRMQIAAAVALILVLGIGTAIFFRRFSIRPVETPAAVRARRSVAILGFKNLSAANDVSWLSTAIGEMLNTELADEKIRTIPGESVARMKVDLGLGDTSSHSRDTLAKIRKILSADYVIGGTYVILGPADKRQIRLDVQLQEIAGGNVVAAVAESGTEDRLFDLVSRVGSRLRENLGAGAAPGSTAVKASLPSVPTATRAYAEALAKLRVYENLQARQLLERAVAEDPDFAPAHISLAEAYHALGYDQKARKEAQIALARSAGLPRETRLSIESQAHSIMGNFAQAAEIKRALWRFFPDNLDYALGTAFATTYAGNGKEALAVIDSVKKTWDDPRVDVAESEIAESVSSYLRSRSAAKRAVAKADARGERLLAARARLFEGWASLRMSDVDSATAAFTDAKQRFDAVSDRAGLSQALNGLASVYFDANNLPLARQTFEEVRKLSVETGNRQSEGSSLINLAFVSKKEGDLAGARKMLRSALELARETADKPGISSALDLLGSVESDSGNLAEARKLIEEALAINREIGAQRPAANNLNNLAVVANKQGDLAGAERLLREAMTAYKTLGDPAAAADLLNNLAVLQKTRGDFAGAERSYNEAADVYRSLKKDSDTAMVAANLASLFVDRGELERGRKSFENALATWRKTGERSYAVYAMMGIGDIQHKSGTDGEAEKTFRAALKERQALGEKGTAAESTVALAEVLLEEGRVDEAKKLTGEAAAEFEAEQLGEGLATANALASRIAIGQGKLADARKYAAKAQQLAASSSDVGVKKLAAVAEARVALASGVTTVAIEKLNAIIRAQTPPAALQLEARLALAEAKLAAHRREEALRELEVLQWDATKSGFNLIARKAAQLR